MKFQARIDDHGKLEVNWSRVNLYLSRWKPGTVLDLEIVRRQRRRSPQQRSFYWAAVLAPYAEHLGYDKHEMELLHRQLKIVYFGIKPDQKGIYRNVPHVFAEKSDKTVGQKSKFLEWVLRVAARDGCYIDIERKRL